MFRMLTSMLWVFVMLVFGFDAVAQPCDLRLELQSQSAQTVMADMPCHQGMAMNQDTQPSQSPEHQSDTCCCAALLTNIVALDQASLDQPAPGISAWAVPLPDTANSVSFEYEPPPPRA